MQNYQHAYNAAMMAGKYDLAESIAALWLDSLAGTASVEAATARQEIVDRPAA